MAENKYLDQAGVDAFWSHIKDYINKGLIAKADVEHIHDISDVVGLQEILAKKANTENTYTKIETNTVINEVVSEMSKSNWEEI